MGKTGRIVCITLPVIFTLATTASLLAIWLAHGTTSSSHIGGGLYFVQIEEHVTSARQKIFDIYLWNYCNGASQGHLGYCSHWQSGFGFEPAKALHFNPIINSDWDKGLDDAIEAYQRLAKVSFTLLIISQATNVAASIFALLAAYSRWGSFLTWLVSVVSASAITSWAAVVTVMFGTLTGALNARFPDSELEAKFGTSAFAVTWLASAFSIAAATAWFFSICCCSGKSHDKGPKRHGTFGVARQYEQLPEPMLLQEKYRGKTRDNPDVYGETAYLRRLDDEIHGLDGGRNAGSGDAYEPFRNAPAPSAAAYHGRRGSDVPDVLLVRPSYEDKQHRRSQSADPSSRLAYDVE